MTDSLPNELDQLIHQADQALSNSVAILTDLLKENTSPSENTTTDTPQRLQLILQYRLDTQDALAKLLQLNQGLMQILGITPQQSAQMNLDRLEYAVGNDDVHQILSALSQLVHSLSRVAYRYQQSLKKASLQKQTRPVLKEIKFDIRIQKTITYQKEFLKLLAVIQDQWVKPSESNTAKPSLETLRALRIITEKWFIMLQNNLKLSHQYYKKTNEPLKLDHQLNTLLQKVEMILEQLPPMNQPYHFFTPPQHNLTELEQRASAKRLRPFFNH